MIQEDSRILLVDFEGVLSQPGSEKLDGFLDVSMLRNQHEIVCIKLVPDLILELVRHTSDHVLDVNVEQSRTHWRALVHSIRQEHLSLPQPFEVEVVVHALEKVDLLWWENVLRLPEKYIIK